MSAAIFLRRYTDSGLTLFDYGAKDLMRVLDHVRERMWDDSLVSISDFGMNGSGEELMLESLRLLRDRGASVVWVDHHIWDPEKVKLASKFAHLILNPERCATESMALLYLPGDEVGARLASIARETDFSQSVTQEASRLQGVITYLNHLGDSDSLLELAWKFSKGIIWDEVMRKCWEKYESERVRETRKLKESLTTSMLGSVSVSIGFCSPVLSANDGFRVVMSENTDLGILVRGSENLLIKRATGSRIQCNRIALMFGGGGHAFLAGGELPEAILNEGTGGQKMYILGQLKRYFKNSSSHVPNSQDPVYSS
jgi:oligoribonuclease NrnB/cAMP/cGMP phosphodiesterase (DHH superfamily)